jgi:hypothetical protein
MCRFHVATSGRRTNKNRKRRPCWSVTKLASITFSSLAFSYWIDKPRFLIEGKTCYCSHHTFLLGFPTGWLSCPHQGCVKVRYWRAPARLRYSVGSATGGPAEAESSGDVSIGVVADFQAVMPTLSRISLRTWTTRGACQRSHG